MDWVQSLSIMAIWFWAGLQWGSYRERKRSAGDTATVKLLAKSMMRVRDGLKFVPTGSEATVAIDLERYKDVIYKIVVSGRKEPA